jgi:dipeptidyl aminopeptidase/acylaminoacyl peptidase
MSTTLANETNGILRGIEHHFYRKANDRQWHELGKYRYDGDGLGIGIMPLAVDPEVDAVYVLQRLSGRKALYRVYLDGTRKEELVFASPTVDVDDVVRVGRSGRVIGVTYTDDVQKTRYFDPAYQAMADTIRRALPNLPLINFVSASADEQVLLIHAGSDADPGGWYIHDRTRKTLGEVLVDRPGLRSRMLSRVQAITYPAADGTRIPGYLTLPPNVTVAKDLPAIVLPHGGPGYRDKGSFDWLVQYFAQRGFAVLQPNFRGSGGYGDAWYMKNGFQSWKTAVGDICDGGRWLVKSGIADSSKLAIFGWSYGGYAALQSNVLDPDLFKAVVAVAPVTDLALRRKRAYLYTDSAVVREFIGSGRHVSEGSPARNAKLFRAPVLMFHGDKDDNVEIVQSRRMDRELRWAGKSSELIVYPQLDHALLDGDARADMLRRSDAFLRAKLGI